MQNTFRKNILCAAALLAIGGSAFADTTMALPASVTIYGRIDLALEANSNGSTNRTAVQNFSSRLGFKGAHAFNEDLSGVFQIETGVAPDDTTQSKTLASRNSFVGLTSKAMGGVLVGTHDMPLKSMEGTATSLWAEGDLQELIIHGKASRSAIGSAVIDNVHTRRTNMLMYTSPKFADVVAKLAYSPDEVAPAAAAGVPAYAQPMVGASLYWTNGTFNAGYAYQSQDNFIKPTATTSSQRWGAYRSAATKPTGSGAETSGGADSMDSGDACSMLMPAILSTQADQPWRGVTPAPQRNRQHARPAQCVGAWPRHATGSRTVPQPRRTDW